jgi:hypothetical protein
LARWSNLYATTQLFDDELYYTDIWSKSEKPMSNLGASMASLILNNADHIKGLFLTNTKNEQGIYGVKLYIRGKPWVITVNDEMLFDRYQDLYFS